MAVTDTLLVALVLAGLAACAPEKSAKAPALTARAKPSASGEQAYRQPPAVLAADQAGGGRVRIFGLADPGVEVRLATPSGRAALVRADKDGRWMIVVADESTPRLFGLSVKENDRVVQSDGYLALAPGGLAIRLRSGAGALVLGAPQSFAITALDYDRKGGAVISGRADAGEHVGLWVDGVSRGTVAADADGRFFLDLDEPLGPGRRLILAKAGTRTAAVAAQVDAPTALSGGPFATERADNGWRIVWLTPGGGLQTTLIFSRPEARA